MKGRETLAQNVNVFHVLTNKVLNEVYLILSLFYLSGLHDLQTVLDFSVNSQSAVHCSLFQDAHVGPVTMSYFIPSLLYET